MKEHLLGQSERGQQTLIQLDQALHRLLEGAPERTPNDGRISLSRINKEAGLSSGGIYHYEDFVEYARSIIDKRKQKEQSTGRSLSKVSEQRLRQQRDKEKQLKESYREQRDNIKAFCDQVITKNAQLEFALFEALEKIEALEEAVRSFKVVDISQGKIT